MTITTTLLGSNTVELSVTGSGTTLADLTTAVANAITGTSPVNTTGWALHDTVTTPVLVTQVFKAINVDAVTYKYLILRWSPRTQELNTSCCEDWNVTTHVATNEVFTFYNCAAIGYNLTACDIILMIHPRWALVTTYLNGEPCLWAGVFEMEREDPADTASEGYPCFGWISSNLWNLGSSVYSAKPLNLNDHTLISLPRTRTGNTGIAAAKGFAGNYGITQVPTWLSTTAGSINFYLSSNQNKFAFNRWDTTKRLVLPIKPMADYAGTVTNFGNIFGLKVLAPSGAALGITQLKVNDNGNFDSAGVLKDHIIFNTHHKPQSFSLPALFTNNGILKSDVQVGSTTQNVKDFVSIGAFYYCLTNGATIRLCKINATNYQNTDLSITGNPSVFDIAFDGERYIYIATSNGITKLDTTNDSMTHLAIVGGVATIAISSTFIVCCPYVQNATPTITLVDIATFSVLTGTLGDFTSGSATLTTFTEVVRFNDAVVGADGSTYLAPTVVTATNFRLVKITATGSISYLAVVNIAWEVGMMLLDATTLLLAQLSSATSLSMTQINLTTFTASSLSNSTISTTGTLSTQSTVLGAIAMVKIAGTVYIVPRMAASGLTSIAALSLGNSVTSTLNSAIVWGDIGVANWGSLNTVMGTAIWTDGAKLYTNNDSGLRIWSKVHGENCSSGVQLGQIALPA